MPTHGSTHGPITPHCPRCGYDQSGEIATWTTQCPVYGRCPECGTRFDWADLFHPTRLNTTWLVEHATGLSDLARRTPRTLLRMLCPPAFWRGVGITATVRPWVLAAWCVATMLLLHAITTATAYSVYYSGRRMWFAPIYGVTDAELRGISLRIALFQRLIDTDESVTGTRAFWTAFRSYGFIDIRPPLWAIAAVGMTLVWILMLTVVPVTRRAAHLRLAHIARAAILALFVAFLIVELHRLTLTASVFWRASSWSLVVPWIERIGSALLFLWTLLWWRAAAKSGWGLNRAGPLVALATLAALLGAAVAVLMIDRNAIAWLLVRWT